MKNSNYCFSLWLLVLIFLFYWGNPAFSQEILPKRLQKEKKRFMDNQIMREDRLFLDQLSRALDDIAQINRETRYIFRSIFPEGEQSYMTITDSLEKTAKKSTYYTFGGKGPARSLKHFINNFFEENKSLKISLKRVLKEHRKCLRAQKYVPSDFETNSLATGAYYYYKICLNTFVDQFGKNIQETLKYAISTYQAMSASSRDPNVKKLKKILAHIANINYCQRAYSLIQTEIIDKMELANKSWANNLVTKMLKLIQNQLVLDERFSKALSKKIESIPTPQEPRLPDFVVDSIEIIAPENIKRCRKITIVARIKNTGQLTTDRSKAKIIFPNGSSHEKSLPRLPPGKVYRVKWKYKLCKLGDKIFGVMANSNYKAWEVDTSNNRKTRKLIVSKYR